MIIKNMTLKVEYYVARDINNHPVRTKYFLTNSNTTIEEARKNLQAAPFVEYFSTTLTFSKFTNKGKLSKQDDSYSIDNAILAEDEFARISKLEESIEEDTARALILKGIINNADFNSELSTIKTKNSHSDWYKNGGDLNSVSVYNTQVPTSVVKEAIELQAIRKKYQGSEMFDFDKTAYITVTERVADHDNGKF